jgi:stearoyl-CoA desaturase (delta-9 desaturase)
VFTETRSNDAAAKRSDGAAAHARKIDLVSCIPFILVHLAALGGALLVPFAWKWVALAVLLYYARMAGTTIGYHRYFSHRSFKTSRAFQFLLALWAETSAQKGALWWAAHHRVHHRYSDGPGDPHSPKLGFWESHMLWILRPQANATGEIKDFSKYPELRFLNEYHLLPPVLLAVLLFFLGGAPALVWGFFVSTVLLWHGTFLVNSVNHIWGTRRFATTDTSRNNGLLALITMGEGWHNNHHHYMASASQGFFWWEIDLSYYLIRAFQALGLLWDVRTPPKKVLQATSGLQPPASSHQQALTLDADLRGF